LEADDAVAVDAGDAADAHAEAGGTANGVGGGELAGKGALSSAAIARNNLRR
jgi:hypothetical protein